MNKAITILLLSVFWLHSNAQNSSDTLLDNVLSVIENPQNTAKTAEYYNQEISKIFVNEMPLDRDKMFRALTLILKKAEQEKNTKEIAESNYNLGRFYIAGYHGYAKAIPYLLQGLTNFEQLDDSTGVSKCYMQLGVIGYVTQYFEDAIKNLTLSIQYSKNPTSVYLMGVTYIELGDFNKAKGFFRKAIKTYEAKDRIRNVDECHMYLGKLYISQGLFDSAHYYLNKVILSKKSQNKLDDLTRPYAFLSDYFLKTGMLDSAKYYAETCLVGTEDGNDEISAMISSHTLSQVFEKQKEFEQAHKYLKLFYKHRYENVQGSTKQKIAELQGVFDFEKRMAQEELKHQEELHAENRSRNFAIFSGLVILLIAGGLWSRLIYMRKAQSELQLEKNTSENLLLNILPEEIAQELKLNGKAEAKNFDVVSILFTDFKDFTQASSKLSAADLVNEINYCFEGFDGIMEKYGIEKIKTIGDSYMAAGGLPVPTNESVKNTVMAALEMQELIAERKKTKEARGEQAFEMRVGIHTGPVVAGIVGVKKFQYDIWGDTVNTASRMESSGDVGRVNISQATYDLLRNNPQFTFESRGKIEVKGKGKMEMWFVEHNS